MKRTQFKDALRNIWKQRISFLSIIVIALLGAMIFLGLEYSVYAMRRNGSSFYAKTAFRDIESISTLLFSENDLDAIRNTEGVTDVEGVLQTSAKVTAEDVRTDANVISLTERINLPLVLEGRLPQNDRECAVEQRLMRQMGWKTGDRISLTDAGGKTAKYLRNETYEITGVILHPDHICNSLSETLYIVVTRDAFDTHAIGDSYMKAEIMTDRSADANRYEQPYRSGVNTVIERLDALAASRKGVREQEAKETAEQLLGENREKLADAKVKLENARLELDDGRTKLEDGERKYAEGEQKLRDGRQKLDETKQKLADAEAELEKGRKELDEAKEKLEDGAKKLEEGKKKLDPARWVLAYNWNQIESAKAKIRDKLRAALEDLIEEDSSEWIHWASPKPANPSDSSERAGDFWITETYRYSIGTSLSDKIGGLLGSVNIPERVLRAVFEKYGEGEYDAGVARQLLADRLAAAAGKYQKEYDELADGCARWDAGQWAYIAGLVQYRDALKEYESGLAKYEEGEEKYANGLKEYEDGLKQYNDGEAEYEKGVKDLADAKKELDDARLKLKDGEQQYEDGLAQYNEGVEALAEAEKSVETLGPCNWITVSTFGNASFVQLGVSADNLKSMEMTFALLFILVGALVIYATVSKMVDEQRRLIGTTKALGFFSREIFVKYLLFGVSATVFGCLLGIAAARFGIERLVLNGFNLYYDIDLKRMAIIALPSVIVVAAGALLAIAAVWFACAKLLRQPAVKLMQQSIPQGAKRTASGKKGALSLYSRLILLNMRTDLKRVLVTVVSIAGCCALVVIGITLRTAVQNTIGLQMRDVIHYDGMVVIDPDADAGAAENVETILTDAGASFVPLSRQNVTIRIRELDMQTLFVGDISELNKMVSLSDEKTGKAGISVRDGILVSNRFSETNKVQPGDSFEITRNGTDTGTVTIAGTFLNYMGRSIYMDNDCYRKVFGTDARTNAYYIRWNGSESGPILESLRAVKGYESYQPSDSFRTAFEAATGIMNLVVLLFIFMSAVMAGVVLMNLTNIYILQKMPELVIMRINGFTVREVIGYVLRETFLTTSCGIVLGIALGTFVGYRIVRSLEQSYLMLDRRISVLSWGIGALLTVAFTVVINWIVLRKVKRLKLTDMS